MTKFNWPYISTGIPDSAFIRGKTPMTKQEVRSITLSKLRLRPESIVVDVGAGTGSIAIEAARLAVNGKVYAIEREPEALLLIEQNRQRFGVELEILPGEATEQLVALQYFDRVVIGGSGGKLENIMHLCDARLPDDGRMVVNAITLETASRATEIFRTLQYSEIEVVSINIARGRLLGKSTLMEGMNPVTVVSAAKTER